MMSSNSSFKSDLSSLNPPPPSSIIIIPGFLTEPITHKLFSDELGQVRAEGREAREAKKDREGSSGLPLEALDAFDPTKALDARAWQQELERMVDIERHELSCFHWASESLVGLFGSCAQLIYRERRSLSLSAVGVVHKLAQKLQRTWREATLSADAAGAELYERVRAQAERSPDQAIYIIGHSLGARIALRFAELLSAQPLQVPVYISAWAPAIDQGELNWDAISKLPQAPELFHTPHDLVLKYLYKLGEVSLTGIQALDIAALTLAMAQKSSAVGLKGAGSTYPQELQISLKDTAIGHLTYLSEMPTLFERSTMLQALEAPRALSSL